MSNLERRLTHYKSFNVKFDNVLDIGPFIVTGKQIGRAHV